MKKTILGILLSLCSLNTFATVTPVANSKILVPATSPVRGYVKLSTTNTSAIRSGVDQIIEAYNSRFETSGALMAGDPRGSAFIQTQESVIADLKKRGAVSLLMSIKNNLVKDLDTNVFMIVDEAKVPLALAFEYRKYDDNTRKHLRIRALQNLTVNNTIQEIEGTPSVAIRSLSRDPAQGGEVSIICLTDLKKKKYHSLTVKIAKDVKGAWGILKDKIKVTNVQLTLWLNILTGNGGIKTVDINSQGIVPLIPFN